MSKSLSVPPGLSAREFSDACEGEDFAGENMVREGKNQ
jgi:hypothetical protein